MKMDFKEYSFVILGNSRFGGYYHREQAIARELATRGYQVVFIEEMPSLAAELRRQFRVRFFKHAIDEQSEDKKKLNNLKVLRPPVIPTLFRSSYTPIIDRWIFKVWFNRKFAGYSWNKSIIMIMFPYLWNGFLNRDTVPAKLIHYDIYDALEMSCRNRKALERTRKGELKLQPDIGLVSMSAHTMASDIEKLFPNTPNIFLPNATSDEFIYEIKSQKSTKANTRKVIGYIGGLDPRWADRELILYTIESFPNYDFSIRASVDRIYRRKLTSYPNVKLISFTNHIQLAILATTFDVGLIPFKQNKITRVVNPLKLYEYFAAGIPVVAMRTDELEYYRDMIYLSDTREEFIRNVNRSLAEDNIQKHLERQQWVKMNTWKHRVDDYISMLENVLQTK